MDFDDTPEEAAYRADVRRLLEERSADLLHLAPGEESPDARTSEREMRRTQQVLAEAGLVGHQLLGPRLDGDQGGAGQVLRGRDQQLRAGREVVQQPPPGDPGSGLHGQRRGAGVAVLDQAGDRRLEDQRAAVGRALGPCPARCRLRGHRASVGGRRPNSHR